MESRRSICSKCKHRLLEDERSYCPGCRKLSPDRDSDSSGGNGSPRQTARKRCPIGEVVCNIFNRIQGKEEINQPGHPKLETQSVPDSQSSSLSDVRPKKRALLIGITYTNWKYKLKGTVNDVKRMKDFLIVNYKFPVNNIRVLTEEQQPCRTPTKKNIEESLKWLVEGCEEGDSLVFYFSGHGVRVPDFQKDEIDGFDEALCPADFQQEGVILDNDINSAIVWPLARGVNLHAFVDACHSGTVLDLVHVYNWDKKIWVDNSPPSGTRKHTDGGLAICISACEDNQLAADTSAFGNGDETNGAMTYLLVEILKEKPDISYGELLDSMYLFLDKANKSGGRFIKILRRLFHQRLLQKPLISASEKFEVYEKKFRL